VLTLHLRTLDRLADLGRALAKCLCDEPSLRCLLLRGALGSGKTTLTRFLVEALPGGDGADISSPSFTLCNVYPTHPPVFHYDLFRVAGAVPEELCESLEAGDGVVVVEWAEYLPVACQPQDFLDICFQVREDERIVHVAPHGLRSEEIRHCLQAAYALGKDSRSF